MTQGNYSGKGRQSVIRDFTIRGWPAVALLVLAGFVLIGPALHVAAFFIKLALMALPLLIVVGLVWFGVRMLRRGLIQPAPRAFREFSEMPHREDWEKWKRDWQERAAAKARRADAKRKNADEDIYYV